MTIALMAKLRPRNSACVDSIISDAPKTRLSCQAVSAAEQGKPENKERGLGQLDQELARCILRRQRQHDSDEFTDQDNDEHRAGGTEIR